MLGLKPRLRCLLNIEADLVHLPVTQHSQYLLWRLLGWHTWIPTLNSSVHGLGWALWPASCLYITQSYWLCYFLGFLVCSWPLVLSSPLSSHGGFCLQVRFTLDSPRCLCLCSPFYYNKKPQSLGSSHVILFLLRFPSQSGGGRDCVPDIVICNCVLFRNPESPDEKLAKLP